VLLWKRSRGSGELPTAARGCWTRSGVLCEVSEANDAMLGLDAAEAAARRSAGKVWTRLRAAVAASRRVANWNKDFRGDAISPGVCAEEAANPRLEGVVGEGSCSGLPIADGVTKTGRVIKARVP
jgi:hypothetical protein